MKPASETESEAANWLARRHNDTWSSSDQSSLDAWINTSTANRIALLRLETVWTKADRLRAVNLVDTDYAADPQAEPQRQEVRYFVRPRWAAAAAVLALVVAPALMLRDTGDAYSTPVGGFQRLPLEDGSRIELNTDTTLDVAFSGQERRIELSRGEAFFKVAKDKHRPFVVLAGDYRVIAIGTAFSVRLKGREVDVAVIEGRVRIEGPATSRQVRPAFVAAGQTADGTGARAVVRPAAVEELDRVLSWRDGLLIFDNQPLGEVAAEFNRYNHVQLLVDSSATGVVVDGTFRASNIEGFTRLLDQGFGVRVARSKHDELVLKRS